MVKLYTLIAVFSTFLITKCFSKLPATDSELMQLTEELFKVADLSLYSNIQINTNGFPLFTVDENLLKNMPTIQKMIPLFDNYIMDSSVSEKETDADRREQLAFMEAVLKTDVMKTLMKFLEKKQAISDRHSDHIYLLKNLWFAIYSRGQRIYGSCGFEHVFMQEIKDGAIMGLHNWIYFHNQQKTGNQLRFNQLRKRLVFANKAELMKFSFSYGNLFKPSNTMLVGTPPELDMALYTLCIVMSREECPVSLGGNKFSIRAYSFSRGPGVKMVASAYPEL